MAAKTLNISALIDERPVGGYQWLIIALCAAVVFLDGFDAQAIGYAAPSLIKAWRLKPPQLGPVFSAGLIGLMLGALLIAPLADRLGRRPVIITASILFGLFTLATAWATDINQLLVLRFLTGLGLGGCMPNGIALTSEYAPTRSRSLMVMIMFNGFTLGSLVGGIIAARLMPAFGWQSVFVVGGVLPLVLAPVMAFTVPESIRFMVVSKARPERILRAVRRVAPGANMDASTQFEVELQTKARMSVRELFRGGRATRTVLLWTVFFMSLLDVYMLVNWLPTAMNSVGASVSTAVMIGVSLQLGAFLGSIPLGWIMDRFGARLTMFPCYLLAAICIALIGFVASTSIPLTFVVVFLAGLGVIGGQTAANAVAATSYPTEVRSTGVGWSLGIGRIGSIVGPALAGELLAMQVSIREIFLLSAIPAAVGAFASLGLGGRARPAAAADPAVSPAE